MDKYDVPFLAKDIKNEMPRHTEKETVIPQISYNCIGLPDNLKERSDYQDNKYMNNHLGEIEEADNKGLLSKSFKMWFANQQHKYHNTGIFNHDGWLEKLKSFIPPQHVLACGFIINPTRHAPTCDGGADVEVGGTGSTWSGGTGELWAFGVTLVNAKCYDQLANNVTTSAGNYKIGMYDGSPTDLQMDSGDLTMTDGFNWVSGGEYTTSTTGHWFGMIRDTGTPVMVRTAGGVRKFRTLSYASALPAVWGTSLGTDGVNPNMKVGHT